MFEKSNNYDSEQPTETRARCKIQSVIWHDSVVRSGLICLAGRRGGSLWYSGAQSTPPPHCTNSTAICDTQKEDDMKRHREKTANTNHRDGPETDSSLMALRKQPC